MQRIIKGKKVFPCIVKCSEHSAPAGKYFPIYNMKKICDLLQKFGEILKKKLNFRYTTPNELLHHSGGHGAGTGFY